MGRFNFIIHADENTSNSDHSGNKGNPLLGILMLLVAVAMAALIGYFIARGTVKPQIITPLHCPDFTSYDQMHRYYKEYNATYLDSDGDGKPCEDQFKKYYAQVD